MQIDSIAMSVRELALQSGWPIGAEKAEILSSSKEFVSMAVVLSPEPDATAFREWISERSKDETYQITYSGLLDDYRALLAPKLVLVIPAGRLIEVAEAEAIAQMFVLRPAQSYAVVIVNAENLKEEKDLKLMERTAWRLLVQSPPSNPSAAKLRDYGVFFWSNQVVGSELIACLRDDAEAFSRWLNLPPANIQSVRTKLLLQLLDEIETNFKRKAKAVASASVDQRQMDALTDSVKDFRARMRRSLETNSELLVNDLPGSFRELGNDLTEILKARLNEKSIRSFAIAKSIIEEELNGTAMPWKEKVTALIQKYTKAIQYDLDNMLHIVAWDKVNLLLPSKAGSSDYPDALLKPILEENYSVKPPGAYARIDTPTDSITTRAAVSVPVAFTLSGGVAVIAWVLSWPASATVTVMAATFVATLALAKNVRKRFVLSHHPYLVENIVRNFVQEQTRYFDSETRQATSALIVRLNQRFDAFEEHLRQKATEQGMHPPEVTVPRQVVELRRHLSEDEALN